LKDPDTDFFAERPVAHTGLFLFQPDGVTELRQTFPEAQVFGCGSFSDRETRFAMQRRQRKQEPTWRRGTAA